MLSLLLGHFLSSNPSPYTLAITLNAETNIAAVLNKFQINESDLSRVRTAGIVLKNEIAEHVESFYEWLSGQQEYDLFFASNPNRLERVKVIQIQHWVDFFDADLSEDWFASLRHIGAVHAHIALPNDIYFAAMSIAGKSLVDRVRNRKNDIPDHEETADSIIKLIFLDAYIVIEEISRIQREKIRQGSQALMEMSTPVTPIWEGILLLPLVGIIDSSRTQNIMNKTLEKISETRAKVFVMDISGVGAIDTAVANQLIKITKATQLMGCETIISGVSPAIARTMVELGINIGEVRTTATLRDSFELALKAVGVNRKLIGGNMDPD